MINIIQRGCFLLCLQLRSDNADFNGISVGTLSRVGLRPVEGNSSNTSCPVCPLFPPDVLKNVPEPNQAKSFSDTGVKFRIWFNSKTWRDTNVFSSSAVWQFLGQTGHRKRLFCLPVAAVGWSRKGAGGTDRPGSNNNAVAITTTCSETVHLSAAVHAEGSTLQGLCRKKRRENVFTS